MSMWVFISGVFGIAIAVEQGQDDDMWPLWGRALFWGVLTFGCTCWVPLLWLAWIE